jgi:hypothetical protein
VGGAFSEAAAKAGKLSTNGCLIRRLLSQRAIVSR